MKQKSHPSRWASVMKALACLLAGISLAWIGLPRAPVEEDTSTLFQVFLNGRPGGLETGADILMKQDTAFAALAVPLLVAGLLLLITGLRRREMPGIVWANFWLSTIPVEVAAMCTTMAAGPPPFYGQTPYIAAGVSVFVIGGTVAATAVAAAFKGRKGRVR